MSPRGPAATADRSAYAPKPAPSQSPTLFSRMTAPTRRPSGRNHNPFDCAASGVKAQVPPLSVQIPPFWGSQTHSAPSFHRGPSPKVRPSPYRLMSALFLPDGRTSNDCPTQPVALWAPVMWAARPSGLPQDGGGGGPQLSRAFSPAQTRGDHSAPTIMESRSE